MKKENVLASYLISLGEEVFHLLLAKGAKKEDAEDIIQNTFYKVYTLLDDLTESNIRPWFFRVALNEYIDLKRKKEQQNIYLTEEIYSKLKYTDHELDAILNKDEIFYLLKDIKKEYKEAFFLKYYYDFSYEEIATILNIKVNSVKQKLFRARQIYSLKNRGKTLMDTSLKGALNKAKRKQLLKTIIITIIVVLILLPILYKTGNYFAAKSSTRLHEQLFLHNAIAQPNIGIDSQVTSNSSMFGGNILTNRSKNINGYLVQWSTLTSSYDWLRIKIDHNELIPGFYWSDTESYEYDKQTKNKVATFYHPSIQDYDDRYRKRTRGNFTNGKSCCGSCHFFQSTLYITGNSRKNP